MSKDLVYILGLGPTLDFYLPNGTPTIGVNDVNAKHTTDYLVIQDEPAAFDWERYINITKNPPKKQVFSQHNVYKDLFPGMFTQLRVVPYQLGILDISETKFNRWELPCSIDSTFLACVVAYRLGFKNIVTHGADFINHPGLNNRLPVILNQYDLLKTKLAQKGVNLYCSNQKSKLSEVLTVKYLA